MKVLLLGYGTMGKAHFEAYRRMDDVEVAAVFSVSNQDGISGVPVYDDLDECLRLDADAADICLPTYLHREAFAKAIRAGKHVFLEKPVAHTREDLEWMVELAGKAEQKVMVGHVLRYFPEYRKLAERIDGGRPASALCSRRAKMPEGTGNWFADRKKSGGVILDLSLHDIDFLRLTLGPVKRIFAQADREHHYALITLRHANGSISRIEGSWRYPGGFTQEIEIAQEGKLLTYSSRNTVPLQVHVTASADEERVEVPAVALKEDPWYRELRDFVQAVKEDREVPVSLEDAYESTKLALLAVESAERKAPVSVG